MSQNYYTYRISVANREQVQVEKLDSGNKSLGQPSGKFRYEEKLTEGIQKLLEITRNNQLNDSKKSRELGEALFDVLFDDTLRQDFVNFYDQFVQQKQQLLRVELDIDEISLPEVAALPWEFMCLPLRANLGTIWLGTAPKLVFSRRRSQWIPAQAIQLNKDEKLRIALVISAPGNLKPVVYKSVETALENLATELSQQVELLPVINPANPEAIDNILARKPHIFHFIGHGRLEDENHQEVGQIAFVDDLGDAMWVDADYFSELFNQHRPGIVILEACEGGMMSASQAFVGVASRVVQQNIPVVMAMQYEVTNATASIFARRFYKQLAQGDPVDIAAQYGRRAIALSNLQYKKRDFATPVILMRVADGHLFHYSEADSQSPFASGYEKAVNELPKQIPERSSQLDVEEVKPTIPDRSNLHQFSFEVVNVNRKGLIIKREQRQAEYFSQKLNNDITLEMVAIPGGTFIMGSPETEVGSSERERPQHQVAVKPFFMGKYPVTQAQWQAVAALPQVNRELDPDPSYFKGSERPVEQISWYDVSEFCDRLTKATERDYRLPSEAEWEYACRAGTTTPFYFGETITSEIANFNGTSLYGSAAKGSFRGETVPVGYFNVANAFGLHDMHGNVWEWCADDWHSSYDNAPLTADVWEEEIVNNAKLLRGGSWYYNPEFCRSARRNIINRDNRNNFIGFRVVVVLA
jgi:formylglycine-generating enzyme required for sulfatase activity